MLNPLKDAGLSLTELKSIAKTIKVCLKMNY